MNYHDDIENATKVLHEGGIILYPTDTIWGIGCDATNAESIERIYKLKQRGDKKAMLVLMDNEVRLKQYLQVVPEIAWELLDVTDKPLTIIYPGAKNFPSNIVSEDGSIGIRIAKDSFCQDLIKKFKKPIVSTSANISKLPSPKKFRDIDLSIISGVDYVVKYKQDNVRHGQPSCIIKLGINGEVKVIRE